MIRCHRRDLEARCRQRGCTLENVRPCIVSEDGDLLTVDETHAAYPRGRPVSVRAVRVGAASPATATPRGGPGTELKKLLRMVGVKASPTCPCNAHAAQMDRWGPDECENRLDEIVGWLGAEAQKRRLPFSAVVAGQLARLAIRRARKSAS